VGSYYLSLRGIKRRIDRDPRAKDYTDAALVGPVAAAADKTDAA
jgi:hypothetical protein